MDTFYDAALVADAFCLGAHWVYDQGEIAGKFPHGMEKFSAPLATYHVPKGAGDLTHYGDQAVLLRESLKNRGGFEKEGWREDWVRGMTTYEGYVDGATRETLRTDGRVASASDDLGGAARMAPILDLGLPLGDAIAAVRVQVGLTHGDAAVADAAEFFTRAVYAVEDGASFEDALGTAADGGIYRKLEVEDHLEKALKLRDIPFLKVAKKLGQACGVDDAFPLALFFLLRPETDFHKTMSDNAMAGGDSSARGMLVALLFAADDSEVAADWVGGLKL